MLKLLICDDDQEITKQVSTLLLNFQKKHKINLQITVKNSGEFILANDEFYDLLKKNAETEEVEAYAVGSDCTNGSIELAW